MNRYLLCQAKRCEKSTQVNIYQMVCVRRNVGHGKIFCTREHIHIRSWAIPYRVLQTIFIPLELSARIQCQTAGTQFEIRLFERCGNGEVCTNFTIGKPVNEINERSICQKSSLQCFVALLNDFACVGRIEVDGFTATAFTYFCNFLWRNEWIDGMVIGRLGRRKTQYGHISIDAKIRRMHELIPFGQV